MHNKKTDIIISTYSASNSVKKDNTELVIANSKLPTPGYKWAGEINCQMPFVMLFHCTYKEYIYNQYYDLHCNNILQVFDKPVASV